MVFVVSHTEEPHLTGIIKANGGKVAKVLTEKADFFVQGYNKEDDGRLGEAGDNNVRVISPEYINECVEFNRVLEIQSQALGPEKTGTGFLPCLHTSAIENCFKPPSLECREREELPQSFGEFLKTEKYLPTSERNVIYLLPFDKESRQSITKKRTADREVKTTNQGCLIQNEGKKIVLDRISKFLEAFFCMPVKVLPALFLTAGKKDATLKAGKYNYSIAVHRSGKNNIRLDAMEIIAILEELRPKDGFCILGITSEDICEDPSDNAPLLGRATGDQVGVLSTCYHDKAVSQTQAKSRDSLRALLNTAAHETMHMFGMDHCSYYSCIMNSWSDPTADPSKHPEKVAPLHLCPVDLRKLHYSVGFHCITRYKNLQKVHLDFGINEEVDWIQKILEIIEADKK